MLSWLLVHLGLSLSIVVMDQTSPLYCGVSGQLVNSSCSTEEMLYVKWRKLVKESCLAGLKDNSKDLASLFYNTVRLKMGSLKKKHWIKTNVAEAEILSFFPIPLPCQTCWPLAYVDFAVIFRQRWGVGYSPVSLPLSSFTRPCFSHFQTRHLNP